ncbi:cysteine hydrolase family protein [Neorhizobium alkalisoli]|uniref:Nicotinamidase-related amidase n=1 Tax=Neorhizobium alkalisoli TaxID=528178 RepID=A0A561QNS3_9HYPH|nr:isochorismatase family protein [Neorhizobium alkalisoli]TWF52010.1 nicotinamidase-related amidase [Neorhizobium alkalisoli]
MFFPKIAAAAGALVFATLSVMPAQAETIIDDWSKVKVPAAPELKPATLDAKTTALLLLDFNGAQDATKGPCNKDNKPRCLASLPKVQAFLEEARKAGVYIVYTLGGAGEKADIATAIAPKSDDPVVKSGPNKFINTDLGKLLEAKGIKTVIVTGTASEGAVLNTGAQAAFTGMNVVVPVDGMSSTELYAEQYVAWHFTHAPGVSAKTTLTQFSQIKF